MTRACNAETLSKWLTDLPLKERAEKLNKISQNLTVCAREFQLPSADTEDKSSIIKKLLGLSELHHKISAQVGKYLVGEEVKVYPVDVFSRILYDIAGHYEILPFLNGAINFVMTGSWTGDKNSL